jgi:hypothetical protein
MVPSIIILKSAKISLEKKHICLKTLIPSKHSWKEIFFEEIALDRNKRSNSSSGGWKRK